MLRIRLAANQDTGLAVTSWARIEQVTTIRPQRVGKVIGEADATTMMAVNRALAVFLAIG
jgi:mRNA interferase MazF